MRVTPPWLSDTSISSPGATTKAVLELVLLGAQPQQRQARLARTVGEVRDRVVRIDRADQDDVVRHFEYGCSHGVGGLRHRRRCTGRLHDDQPLLAAGQQHARGSCCSPVLRNLQPTDSIRTRRPMRRRPRRRAGRSGPGSGTRRRTRRGRAGTKRRADDHDADVAEHARHQVRGRDDDPGPRQRHRGHSRRELIVGAPGCLERVGLAHEWSLARARGMGVHVCGTEASRGHVGVDLRRRQARARAAPGPRAGPPRRRAGGSRTNGAACAARRPLADRRSGTADRFDSAARARRSAGRRGSGRSHRPRVRFAGQARADVRQAPAARHRGTPRAPRSRDGQAARCAPCAPCRAPGSRRVAGPGSRARRRRAR